MNGTLARTLRAVRDTVATTPPSRRTVYECAFCHLGFDADRLNCPACGGPVHEQSTVRRR